MGFLLLIATIAPVAFMLHFVYVRDKYEREPLGQVLLVFFLSFFTVIPAGIFEMLFVVPGKLGLFGLAISVWLVIALSEESVKYLAVRWLAYPRQSFNEVYDGIIYGVAASLGFAAIENLCYVFLADEGAWTIAVLRALLAVPGHALWGVMLGYYLGLSKFEPDGRKAKRLRLKGWLMAIFWHGLYDFFAFGTEMVPAMAVPFIIGLIVTVVFCWVIAMRLIRLAQEQSSFKRPNPLVNPVQAFNRLVKFCHACGRANKLANEYCVRCSYRFPDKNDET